MDTITAYEPKTQTFFQTDSDDFFAATFARNEESSELAQRLGALDRFMTDNNFRLSADLRKEFKLAYVTKGEKAVNVEQLIVAVIAEIAVEFPAETQIETEIIVNDETPSLKMSISEFRALTINQAIERLGVKPSRDTYIYLNEKMELDCIEKSDRHSDPMDEFMSMGYVSAHLR